MSEASLRDGLAVVLRLCARERRAAAFALLAIVVPCTSAAAQIEIIKPARIAGAAKTARELPPFRDVKRTVETHLGSISRYRQGDLLSQSYVEPIFGLLEKRGWKVADRAEILKLVPLDGEEMVVHLRSDPDRVFMRGVERFPGGYDRVDHLSRLSDADLILWRLVAGPDGYKMVEYLTTAPGGTVMGDYLSQAPHGKNFNNRTGRIYTEAQLIARLNESYLREERARAKRK